MVDPRAISEIVGFWRNSDPKLYDKFMGLFSQYVNEVTVAVTEAPSSEILQAQGRAQQARKFLQMFTEIREPNRATP